MPPSNPTQRTLWILREGDKIDFRSIDIQAEISFLPADLPTLPDSAPQTLVKDLSKEMRPWAPSRWVDSSDPIEEAIEPTEPAQPMSSAATDVETESEADGDHDVAIPPAATPPQDLDVESNESDQESDEHSDGTELPQKPATTVAKYDKDDDDTELFETAKQSSQKLKTYVDSSGSRRKRTDRSSDQLSSEGVAHKAAARSVSSDRTRKRAKSAAEPLPADDAEAGSVRVEDTPSRRLRAPTKNRKRPPPAHCDPYEVEVEPATKRIRKSQAPEINEKEKESTDKTLSLLGVGKRPETVHSGRREEKGKVGKSDASTSTTGAGEAVKHSATEETDSSEDEIAVAPPSVTKTPRAAQSTPATVKVPLQALLSSSKLTPDDKGWMTSHKIRVVEETPSKSSTNYVCIVRDESLPTTVKVLKALLAGKLVVSDEWIKASKKEKLLQDPADYVHEDLDVRIDQNSRKQVFSGKRLLFTEQAAITWGKDWHAIQEIAKAAGASEVTRTSAFGVGSGNDILLLGVDNAVDKDAIELIENGRTVYNRRIIGQSIVRGKLDIDSADSELKLPLSGSTKSKKKAKN